MKIVVEQFWIDAKLLGSTLQNGRISKRLQLFALNFLLAQETSTNSKTFLKLRFWHIYRANTWIIVF